MGSAPQCCFRIWHKAFRLPELAGTAQVPKQPGTRVYDDAEFLHEAVDRFEVRTRAPFTDELTKRWFDEARKGAGED